MKVCMSANLAGNGYSFVRVCVGLRRAAVASGKGIVFYLP